MRVNGEAETPSLLMGADCHRIGNLGPFDNEIWVKYPAMIVGLVCCHLVLQNKICKGMSFLFF